VSSYLVRHAASVASGILAWSPALILEGARQVGKSTLVRHLGGERGVTVASFDDAAVRDAAAEDPEGFVAQAGDGTLVLDEVQRAPNIALAVKAAIDADRRPGRFILTGSSSLLRLRGLADSLAGRAGRLTLYGFSQGELAGTDDDFAQVVAAGALSEASGFESPLGRSDYVRLVTTGAYPEPQGLDERQRHRWFDSYGTALLYRDLPELRRVVDPARAVALLRILAANQAGELVKARMAREAGLPASTVDGYLDLLGHLGLIRLLPPWTPNLTEREIGRPKGLLLDSGLAARLDRLTTDQLASFEYGKAFGSLLESFVASELLRQQTWTAEEFDLFHYRDRNGTEADLVLELSGGRVIGLEVKAAASFQAGQFKGLKFLRDKLGDRFLAGIVLNTGPAGYRFSDRLYGLPISALWRLAA
jgi:predicted AAA+ superfamily ATPase